MDTRRAPAGGGIQNLRDYIQRTDREPLLGLEWVLEYRVQGKRNEIVTNYFCDICDVHCELVPMIEHLSCMKHRKLYLARTFPHLLPLPPATKEDKTIQLRCLAMEVEKREGVRMFKTDPGVRMTSIRNGKSIVIGAPRQSPRLETAAHKQSRWARALEYLETFEIDNDSEASTVTNLTQKLTADLTSFSQRLKDDPGLLGKLEAGKAAKEVQATAIQGKQAPPSQGCQEPPKQVQKPPNQGQAQPNQGQKSAVTQGQVQPNQAQKSAVALGQGLPNQGRKTTASRWQPGPPVLGQQMPIGLAQQIQPNFGQQMKPNFGQQMQPNFGQQVKPNFGQQMQPNFGQQVLPNLGQQMALNLGQQIPPNLGQQIPPNLGQQMPTSILGQPPPLFFKGQPLNFNMAMPGGPFASQFPRGNQSNFAPTPGFPQWPHSSPMFPPNPQQVPAAMMAGQTPQQGVEASASSDPDVEDMRFFKKLMNLLSVLPEKADNQPASSETAMMKSLFDQRPAIEEDLPGGQPPAIPSEDPLKQKLLMLLASQDPAEVPQPDPKLMAPEKANTPPVDEALANQNKLLELLLQTRQKLGTESLLPGNQDPFGEPRLRDDYQLPQGDLPVDPAPYTRISLSPGTARSGRERFPDIDPDRGRQTRDPEPDLGRRKRDNEPDRGRRMRSPERGPRRLLDGPEHAPRRERSRSYERRPRQEEDFFAPTEEERRSRRDDEQIPGLSADLLRRIRGKDMFTVSAILSEYAEKEGI